MCGSSREEAMALLTTLENATRPQVDARQNLEQ